MTQPTALPSLAFIRGFLAATGEHQAHGASCGCPQLATYVPGLIAEVERLTAEPEQVVADVLTDIERDIARLLLGRMTYAEIADRRNITVNTVKTHAKAIYRKVGVVDRAGLAAALRGRGPM